MTQFFIVENCKSYSHIQTWTYLSQCLLCCKLWDTQRSKEKQHIDSQETKQSIESDSDTTQMLELSENLTNYVKVSSKKGGQRAWPYEGYQQRHGNSKKGPNKNARNKIHGERLVALVGRTEEIVNLKIEIVETKAQGEKKSEETNKPTQNRPSKSCGTTSN